MPHTYTSLRQQVRSVNSWVQFSNKIPLVHSIRKHTTVGEVLDSLLNDLFNGVVTKSSTQSAGNLLGIPENAMFFYAGRAFPEEGVRVTLLFGGAFDAGKTRFEEELSMGSSSSANGSARPFDSGGLAKNKLLYQVKAFSQPSNPDDPIKQYFDAHNVDLPSWRDYLAHVMTIFFLPNSQYWFDVPSQPIDNVTFTKNTEWRNWTFEAHSTCAIPPSRADAIFVEASLESEIQDFIGFGGGAKYASAIKSKVTFCSKPGLEAEKKAKSLAA